MYPSLLIHSKTRKRDLVDILQRHGLCVSYDRVLQVTAGLSNKVIIQFEIEGAVCPLKFIRGFFTTGNSDNIDHNPTSNRAMDSFYSTAISMTGDVTCANFGIERQNSVKS